MEIYNICNTEIKLDIEDKCEECDHILVDYIDIFNKVSCDITDKKYKKIDGVVYCITNNDKKYIGSTINLHKRFYNHLVSKVCNKNSSVCILKKVSNTSKYELELYEDYFIYKYDTLSNGRNKKYNNIESKYLFRLDVKENVHEMLKLVAEYKVRYTLWQTKIDSKLVNKTGIFEFIYNDIKYAYYSKRRLSTNIDRYYSSLIGNCL